jgi:hypothetical protein
MASAKSRGRGSKMTGRPPAGDKDKDARGASAGPPPDTGGH